MVKRVDDVRERIDMICVLGFGGRVIPRTIWKVGDVRDQRGMFELELKLWMILDMMAHDDVGERMRFDLKSQYSIEYDYDYDGGDGRPFLNRGMQWPSLRIVELNGWMIKFCKVVISQGSHDDDDEVVEIRRANVKSVLTLYFVRF